METRLASRVNITFRVDSKIDADNNQQVKLAKGDHFTGVASDISALGMGFRIRYFLPKGLVLGLEIEGAPFGLKEHMQIKAEIRHCEYVKYRTYECGVKFIDISPKYKKAIEKFVSAHDKRKERRLGLDIKEASK